MESPFLYKHKKCFQVFLLFFDKKEGKQEFTKRSRFTWSLLKGEQALRNLDIFFFQKKKISRFRRGKISVLTVFSF
jgi:hypothetical protein